MSFKKHSFLLISIISSPLIASETVLWRDSTNPNIRIEAFEGKYAEPYAHQIALLRMTMFREYPYLYDANPENPTDLGYEMGYLKTYFNSNTCKILLLLDQKKVVGFSNAIVLNDECDEIKKPFEDQKLNLADYLYIGEVMIQEKYRGKHLLSTCLPCFAALAQKHGCKFFTAMTVQRPDDHPAKPTGYEGLENIWKRFGGSKLPGATIEFPWKQVDTDKEEINVLDIWTYPLPSHNK